MKKKKKARVKNPNKKAPQIVCGLATPSKTDTDGSWTGVPLDKNDIPVQDADDL